MNEPILPDNDRDLQLARAFGQSIASGSSMAVSSSDDPMAASLSSIREVLLPIQDVYRPDANASHLLWQSIEQATSLHEKKAPSKTPIYTLQPAIYKFAAAAACFLAMVALGWFLLQPSSKPELLAKAGDQLVNYTLADGSEVTLRPHSQLFRLSDDETASEYRLQGEAFFDVTRIESRTFSVEAGNARISVLGTQFNVNTWGDAVSVFLQEGRVELRHLETDRVAVLSPGELGVVSNEGVQAQSAAAEAFLDWMRNEIAFSHTPIKDVTQELAFHYNIHIEIPSERAGETISGPIALNGVDFVLNRLALVMGGGQFVEIEPTRYRFESR